MTLTQFLLILFVLVVFAIAQSTMPPTSGSVR